MNNFITTDEGDATGLRGHPFFQTLSFNLPISAYLRSLSRDKKGADSAELKNNFKVSSHVKPQPQ
jgi:hypothetical protein